MKGDYSQPGLVPDRYLEQIDLPSAYLVPVPSLSLSSTELSCAKGELGHSGPVGKTEARLNPRQGQAALRLFTAKSSSVQFLRLRPRETRAG
jgi:hypothetical protein